MLSEAMILAAIQVIGTFVTLGLKSGAKKRTTMLRTVWWIRRLQIIDIVSSVFFTIYSSISGTAFGTAAGIGSALINTIILQGMYSKIGQKYEAIWSIEYWLMYTDKERAKTRKTSRPILSLEQAIYLYIDYKLEEDLVHEKVLNYKGPLDSSITKDDRVFAGRSFREWKDLFKKSRQKLIGDDGTGGVMKDVAINTGKITSKATLTIIGAIFTGLGRGTKEIIAKRKEVKKHD